MNAGSKAVLIAALILACNSLLPAQVLPSVDVDTARAQINQFLSENELIKEEITKLRTTNEELAADIELWKSWLTGITNVKNKIVDQANSLLDIVSEFASKSVAGRAQTELARYSRTRSILEEKHTELTERIVAAEASIERNSTVVAELEEKITSNLENVDLLKAAIERSAGSDDTINAYIQSLEKALDEAQKFIDQSFQ